MRAFALGLWSSLVGCALTATLDEWRTRSIYQIVTDRYGRADKSTTAHCDPAAGKYCGGTWSGIVHNLDYIQNMGFDAIWISPVTGQITQDTDDGTAYHGYWPQDMYSLNDKFGDVSSLQNLSAEVHARGMYLMVDVVVNHMAWAGDSSDVEYDKLIPFNASTYYHTYCPVNASTSQTDCWLGDDVVTLPDLRTEDEDVQSTFQQWISTFVAKYNIDGLRVDSAGNVDKDFFTGFTDAAAVFMIGEVDSGVVAYACPYQSYISSVMNYPVYFPLIRAFESNQGSIIELVNEISWMQSSCKDTTILGSFSENHDQPRFPSYTSDMAQVKNVLTFTFMADGVPIVYEGQEQHLDGSVNPLNREAIWLSGYNTNSTLYKFITTLNIFRSRVIEVDWDYLTYQNYVFYNDSSSFAMRKGYDGKQVITVLTNMGENSGSRSYKLSSDKTGFTAGDIVTDIVSCDNVTIDDTGDLAVNLTDGIPKVFYLADNLANTTICYEGTTTNPNPVSNDPPPKKGSGAVTKAGRELIMVISGILMMLALNGSFF